VTPRGLRLRVDAMTGATRGYEVHIRAGALDDLPGRIGAAAPASVYVIITPRELAATYGARALAALHASGFGAELLPFDGGEASKTRETWAALTDRMLELRLGRDTCVIALGGGVTGDLAGFVAATYMRGLPFVQVPTTLLAMIDASVGGKTGIDTPAGKNLVGAFHAPRLVVVDPLALRTLPPRELRSGLAEAVKHGAILDADYFDWIADNAGALLDLDAPALAHLIARSVELKAGIVSEDPHELGRRTILNFGHTVAHALERHSGFTIPHGFAVAQGMLVEARIGEIVGITAAGTATSLARVLHAFQLTGGAAVAYDDLIAAMQIDKKARRAEPRFVLLRRLGACAPDAHGSWVHQVAPDVTRRALESVAEAAPGV
jgi:3-dehydroquinate synthase